ncbi:MAG: oligopeptide/dipeptide ABC transporter ATP-binding protein [Bacilli bacterium]|nr:oligopeptide/dipeptide ABC transporter ATP-binding protein [Bacilli bacterium]
MAVRLTDAQRALIAKAARRGNNDDIAISVRNLSISFKTDNGKVQAVRGVSFDLHRGETLCIVGESGSGKSVTSKAIMGILSPNAIIEGGEIIYEGEDLLKVSEEEFHRIRGHKIGMIFQDPLSSLNPIVKIGKQIIETMLINSNQLKNHFNELIAEELVAYKNLGAIRDAEITAAKNEYNRVAGECAKEEDGIKGKMAEARSAKNAVEVASLREKLAALTAQNKEKKAAAKAKMNEAILAAKNAYKEQAPGLKAALDKRKAEARIENKQYAEGLRSERDAKLVDLQARREALHITDEAKAQIANYDGLIRKEETAYRFKFVLNFFFNKRKQALRAAHEAKLRELKEERAKYAKAIDALNAEEEAIIEDYNFHVKITKAMARKKAIEVMREVGIPQPEKRFYQYPFEFSGGMRQRIVIAIALIAEPDILICDEPTTALDVTIQAQILELINRLKARHNMSVIFITHDLGVVANMADRVAVMYAGKICEYGTESEIFFDPRHPYTWALLSSIPDIDSKERLEAIPGTPPDMIYPPEGDAFALRNRYALAVDFKYQPPFFKISETHYAATWLEYDGAPDIEPPAIVSTRIYNALKEEEDRDDA